VFNIELLAQAEDELSEAHDWYENELSGLGSKLYKEINHYFTIIESNPYYFPVKYPGELRVAALNKFPYLIIYWVDETNNMILVASIFHTSREPKRF